LLEEFTHSSLFLRARLLGQVRFASPADQRALGHRLTTVPAAHHSPHRRRTST
jgi:hypothetical protein